MKKTALLRKLIAEEKLLLAGGGCYDCLSARIIEKAGFKAISTSGYSIHASLLGQADIGLLTLSEMANHIKH